jgi:hypothetical protein
MQSLLWTAADRAREMIIFGPLTKEGQQMQKEALFCRNKVLLDQLTQLFSSDDVAGSTDQHFMNNCATLES